MPYKPELHNAESVVSYYESFEAAPFSVYAGHKIDETLRRFSYDGDDKIKGSADLAEALASVTSNPDNTNTYLLVIYKKVGKKNVPENSITFQLNTTNKYLPMPGMMAGTGYSNNGELSALRAEIAALKMQMAADQEEEEEEETEEDNFIGSMLKSPEMQKMLMSGLINLMAGSSTKVTNLAGIENENPDDQAAKINEAVNRLYAKNSKLGDDLLLLAEIAENNPAQFNMLISMLRK
jgi:hypothetical protein